MQKITTEHLETLIERAEYHRVPNTTTTLCSLKHWLGGMVNNPTTGALSHDKVWANICAGTMTWQFCHSDPTEWQWWAYGGMVGGYGLARRAIAAAQKISESKDKS